MSLRTARRLVSGSIIVLSLLAGACACAQESRIAVIIDDVGNQLVAGRRSVALPGPVVLAILPHTPFADTLADEAAALGKEILIHMPMQASRVDVDPGPGSLALTHDPAAMDAALSEAITAVPHAIGVSNHMGSLLTRDPLSMRAFMQTLASRNNLLFLDSYTTHLSVGLMLAREHGIPALKRDVFLDADPSVEGLEAAWLRLLEHGLLSELWTGPAPRLSRQLCFKRSRRGRRGSFQPRNAPQMSSQIPWNSRNTLSRRARHRSRTALGAASRVTRLCATRWRWHCGTSTSIRSILRRSFCARAGLASPQGAPTTPQAY